GAAAPAKHAAGAKAAGSKAARRANPAGAATYGPHASAAAPGSEQGPAAARKTRLAAHSGGKSVPGWLVALALGLALVAVFLGRRRIGRLVGTRASFLRRSA